MSELRIRSEAMSDAGWAQPFLPPAARDEDDPFGDGEDFGPLLAAAGRALTALFGLAVTVRPGRPETRADGGPVPRVAPVLAGLLATLRLGGDPGRAVPASGATLARHGAAIATALDAAAARDWPATTRLAQFDLDILCNHAAGTINGHASIVGPPRIPPPAPQPIMALRHEVLGLPMRLRVELAADMLLVSSLLPLRTGQVIAIAPPLEMPLILGRHRIGRALVSALPDGRQQAELVAIHVEPVGDRA
jgi:hypothetical protein